jgi:isoquinoline 1-oxidoreductase beta subunit
MRLGQSHHRIPDAGQNLARNRAWGNFSTGGSRGIRESHDYVRKGGATAARDAGAGRGGRMEGAGGRMPAASSVVTHTPAAARHLRQGGAAAAKLAPPAEVKLKDPKDWKLAGKPWRAWTPRTSSHGKQVYGMDLKLPGMLNAAIKDCPVFGGKVKSFNAAAIEKRPA